MPRRLPILLLPLLLLAGCQTTPTREPSPATAPETAPAPQPLEVLWQASAESSRPQVEAFLDRLRGRPLRRAVQAAAFTGGGLDQVHRRLESARAHSRRARAVLAELYGYRRAGGVFFGDEEKVLWQRLETLVSEGAAVVPDRVRPELERARLSLAVQAARAWFHHQGVKRLRQGAAESVALHRQVVERRQTASRLEGSGREPVLQARKELARAESRLKRLQTAERHAARALGLLTGVKDTLRDGSAVRSLPAGVGVSALAGRADLARLLERLSASGLQPVWPGEALVGPGETVTRALARLARLEGADLLARLGLEPVTPAQQEAAGALAETLHRALARLRGLLYGIHRLRGQLKKLRAEEQAARRAVNRLRARYSARRADLLEILSAQIRAVDISARAGYVERRIHDQRAAAWLALGLP